MAYIRNYKPRWSKYINDDDVETKVLEFSSEKNRISDSLDVTEVNLHRTTGIYTDYYKEKYDEEVDSIDEIKNEDLKNLVCFNRV